MNKQEHKMAVPVIGASSLLVIFAVLCMTVFALLGLSTVRADQRLSDVRTEAVSAYYRADCLAEEILARLRNGEPYPEYVLTEDGIFRYACPISSSQELLVEVRGHDWKVLRWQAVSTVHWKADDSITVWDGSEDPDD